ncbi:MAG: hypothetical protein JW776_12145 [Candidatus Lokiarchaeota archaeon]|nr:hypothetical protein [Candidatus Lokiarchaeota archaeon]
MEIEEELAELKAELAKQNENSNIVRFVNSKDYRALLKKQPSKICEICGKEYKITHLCDTAWKFIWSDFKEHYSASSFSKVGPRANHQAIMEKRVEVSKKIEFVPPTPSQTTNSRNKNGCGCCICVFFIFLILIFVV